jgi:hypothetical protein
MPACVRTQLEEITARFVQSLTGGSAVKTAALLALSLLVVSSATVCAQDYRHEVSVGVGVGTIMDMAGAFMLPIYLIYSMGTVREEVVAKPALTVYYRYHASRLISVGGNFAYQKFDRELYFLDETVSKNSINYYTFMGRVDFNYVRTRLVRMYSGIAFGLYNASESGERIEDNSETRVGLQVNAVGLRVGKQLAGYLELGFGFNGILAAGITYEF